MLVLDKITKDYKDGENQFVRALTVTHLEIPQGTQLALIGPSGSGKSTLLHCIAGLITPTTGSICDDAVNIQEWTETDRAKWRGSKLGYVFQQCNLLESLTVQENIMAGAYFSRRQQASSLKARIAELLHMVGLDNYENKKPREISMGEQQRVAIVRVLIKEPQLILADEPTASLDEKNSAAVIRLLREYGKNHQCTCIVATHDAQIQQAYEHQCILTKGGDNHEVTNRLV